MNDGLLRVLAMLAQTGSDRTLVLLDEIENGINPEIVESLVKVLVATKQQLIVTTHSPMILNYLDDDIAKPESESFSTSLVSRENLASWALARHLLIQT